MKSYWKYLPIGDSDKKWGIAVTHVGHGLIEPAKSYPLSEHPSPYAFKWETGRTLYEYQLIYISRGTGVFESASAGKIKVEEGALILLFPGEWHRYKPNEDEGWYEYWIGFTGHFFDDIVSAGFFKKENPVLQIGVRNDILDLYRTIILHTEEELLGYQQLIGGSTLYILGIVQMISKAKTVSLNHEYDRLVQKAKLILRENISNKISLEKISEELRVSYSLFRKVFKKYTGISPWQYFMQLKIEHARYLLSHTNKLIKDIAYELNFESVQHFSRYFKAKTGISPTDYKNQ